MVPSKDLLPVFPFNCVCVCVCVLFLFLAPSGFPRLARLKFFLFFIIDARLKFLILTTYKIKNRKRKKKLEIRNEKEKIKRRKKKYLFLIGIMISDIWTFVAFGRVCSNGSNLN